MKVILTPDLFALPVQNSLIIALISHALDDRHRIELDADHPTIASWIAAQSIGLREEIAVAIEVSTQAEALEPSHTAVEIVRMGAADFERTPIQLSLDDARSFLERPFVVLLEDAVSDRGFLTRMMSDEERRFFQRRIDAGFVRIDHGGGVGPLARRVRAETENPRNRLNLWVLFDSDAMRPRQPSNDSESLRAACTTIPHHQLQRRYMESYLPPQALQAWAANEANRATREDHLDIFRAFIEMSEPQRHHFNMKHGFERDARRTDASAGDLYDNVPGASRRALARGFGEDIGTLFLGEVVAEADLRRDTGWAELRPVVRGLIARVR